jgi:hypothetical protein
MAKDEATDLLSAAIRHLRDAEHLADLNSACAHRSLDQAYHLAGFGPECARKAMIAAPWMNKLLGHEIGEGAEPILVLAAMVEPKATSGDIRNWHQSYPTLAQWSPESRYEATGTRQTKTVESLLRECSLVVSEIVAALWADGRLSWNDLS